jgi:hypothetical protein
MALEGRYDLRPSRNEMGESPMVHGGWPFQIDSSLFSVEQDNSRAFGFCAHRRKCSPPSSSVSYCWSLFYGIKIGLLPEPARLRPPAKFRSGPVINVVARAINTIIVKMRGGRIPKS